MNITRRSFSFIGAGILLAMSSTPASALVLYYDAYGGFDASAGASGQGWDTFANPVTYGGYTVPDNGTKGQVAWGTGTTSGGAYNGKSYLGINEWTAPTPADQPFKYARGDLATAQPRLPVAVNDPMGSLLGDLTHFNYPLSATGGDQGFATIDYLLHLYGAPDAPESSRLFNIQIPLTLDIWETPNTASAATCPNTAPAGTVVAGAGADAGAPGSVVTHYPVVSDGAGAGSTPCADAYTFTALDWLNVGNFLYNNVNYDVQASGFYDSAARNANLTSTFWSNEGAQSDTAYIRFRIQAVPEPGTVFLFSAGLAGLFFSSRTRRNRKNNNTYQCPCG